MIVILQDKLPVLPWMDPVMARLPGVQPLRDDSWLLVDEAFAGQMAERDRQIAECPDLVLAALPESEAALAELYAVVIDKLRQTAGYQVGPDAVRRPDGVRVALDPSRKLQVLGRLVQEDLCLMQKQGEDHVLTAAALCFPALWTLAEKLGKPLGAIHRPVVEYDADLARRVQRMFDMARPGQVLWRMNYNVNADPKLFHPAREIDHGPSRRRGDYLRAERQCILRLPQSGAGVFSIHTYMVRIASLSEEARRGLIAAGKLEA